MGPFADVALAVTAGPLLAAGAAKIVTPSAKISWPWARGPLRLPAGPRLVGACELAAAVEITTARLHPAAAIALLAYLTLTLVAWRLRGRECACFGVARLAAVGRLHIAANAIGVLLALLVLASPAGSQLPAVVRGGIAVGAAAATLAMVWLVERRRAAREDSPVPCTEQVAGVTLYVSASCPACRALETVLAGMETSRREAVTIIRLSKETPRPKELLGLGVPCAVPLYTDGQPICAPISGISGVRRLIEGITLSPQTRAAP